MESIAVHIPRNICDEADTLYKSMGLTLSSAINLFLTQTIVQGRLPINEVVPGRLYGDAILNDAYELDLAISNGTTTIFDSPEDLFKSWEMER